MKQEIIDHEAGTPEGDAPESAMKRLPRHFLPGLVLLCALSLGSVSAFADAPLNDNFDYAQAVLLGKSVAGTTLDATREAGDPEPDAHNRSVWYSFTPTDSQVVTLSGTTTDDPLAAYLVSGDTLLSSHLLASQVFTSRPLPFYAVAGHTYRICIDDYVPGWISYHGYPFTLGLAGGAALPANATFIEPLSNDSFDQATALSASAASLVMNTTEATFEPFEQEMLNRFTPRPRYSTTDVGGVWVSYTAPLTGQVTLTAQTPTNSSVIIALGQGSSIAGLNLLKGGYNGLIFSCVQGATYKIYLLSQADGQVLFKLSAQGATGGGGGGGNPGGAHAGSYTGLSNHHALLSLSLNATSAFTARLTVDGVAHALKGKLDSTGAYIGTYGAPAAAYSVKATGGSSSADDTVALTFDGETVTGRPRAYESTAIPPEFGTYTALFKPSEAGATTPQGTGFARVTVGKGGLVSLAGKGSDGTPFSASGLLRVGDQAASQFDVYNAALYAHHGLLAGSLTFQSSAAADFAGVLAWTKQEAARGAYYRAGFQTHLNASGARYRVPASGEVALPLPNASGSVLLSLAGGSLSATLAESATLTAAGELIVAGHNPEHLKASINPLTGLLTGSFVHPLDGRAHVFSAALCQSANQPGAFGCFLGPIANGVGESGAFSLVPQ